MSNVVDDRIVSLEFDNKNFEKNVSVTLSTLDKLKAKLNLSGAEKGMKNIQATAKSFNLNDIGRSVDMLSNRFSVMGIAGKRAIENITDSLMGFTGKITNFLTSGIISGGINRAMNIENARFQLQGLLRDGDAVEAVMKNVSDSVDGTAYAMDAAAKVASQLAASGMRAGKDMFTSLRGVAGVAAMTNSSYEEIGRIFTQVAGQGRLMGNDLLSLSSRGMNAAATLADYLTKVGDGAKVTEAQVRDMVTKGQISFDLFSKAMDEAFGEHAKNANQTFQGALSNIKSALARIGQEFVAPLIKQNGPLVNMFNAIREKVNEVKSSIEPLAKVITDKLSKAIESVTRLIKGVNEDGSSINDILESTGDKSKIGLIFETIGNMAQPVITILKSFREALTNAFTPINNTNLYNLFVSLRDFSKQLLISESTVDKITRTFKGLFAVLDLISMLLTNTFGATFRVIATVATEVAKALGYTNVEILDITATIGDAIVAFRDWIVEHNVLGRAIEKVVPFIVEMVKGVSSFVKKVYELPMVQGLIEGILDTFKKAITLGEALFELVGDTIETFLSKLSTIEDFKLSNIPQIFKMLLESIGETFDNSKFKDIGQNIIQGLVRGISEEFGEVIDKAKQIAEQIINTVKSLLGIHSPSKVFMMIGAMVVTGFVAGVMSEMGQVEDVAQAFVNTFTKMFSEIDLTDIMLVGLVGGSVYMANRLINILDTFAKPIEGFAGVVDQFKDTMKQLGNDVDGILKQVSRSMSELSGAVSKKLSAESFYTYAKGIGLLATSLAGLTLVDQDKLWKSAVVLGGLTAALSILAKQMNGMGNTVDFGKVSILLLGMGASMILLSKAMKTIANLNPEQAITAILSLGGLMGGLYLFMLGLSKLDKLPGDESISRLGTMMLKLSVSLGIMALVIKMVGGMDSTALWSGVGVIAALSAFVGALAGVSALVGDSVNDMGNMFLKLSVSLGIMVLLMKTISKMEVSDITKGLAVIGTLLLFIEGLIAVNAIAARLSGVSGLDSGFGTEMLKITGSLGILALAMKQISGMSQGEINRAIGALGGLTLLFAALTEISKFAGGNAANAGTMLLKMSTALGILVIVIKMVSGLELGDVIKGTAYISACMLLFGAVIKLSQFAGEHASKAGSMILKMSIALGALVVVMRLMRSLSMSDIAKGMVFATGCTAMFAALIAVSKFAGEFAGEAGNMLMKLAVPIAVLAAAVAALSYLPVDGLKNATKCMSMLVGVFSILVASTGLMTKSKTNLIIMGVLVAELAGILYLLSGLPIDSTLGTAKALSVLMLGLGAAVGMMGFAGGRAMGAMLPMLALSGILAIVAAILGVMQALDIQPSIEQATALTILLNGMALALGVLGLVGGLAPTALAGATALGTILGALLVALTGIGGLNELLNGAISDFLGKGLEILKQLATGLGEAIGGFVGGLSSVLPDIGTNLSTFMSNLGGFIEGANSIKPGTGDNLLSLATSMAAMVATGGLQSFLSLFGADSGIKDMKENLPGLGEALAGFNEKLGDGIDPAKMEAAAQALQAIANLQNSLSGVGAVVRALTGEGGLEQFSEALPDLAEGLVEFQEAIGDTTFNTESINSAIQVLQSLASLQNSIIGINAIISAITGEGLETFGSSLKGLGEGIVEFQEAIGDTTFNTESISSALSVLQSLSGLQDSVMGLESLVGWLTGDGLDTFGEDIAALGTGVAGFASAVSEVEFTNVQPAMQAIQTLAGLTLPEKGGWLSDTESLSSFAEQLPTLGTNIAEFATNVTSSDFTNVTSAVRAIKDITTGMQSLSGVNKSQVENFVESIKLLSEVDLSSLNTAFSGDISNFKSVGSKLASTISSGITSSKSSINSAISSLMSSAKSTANEKTSQFKSVGTKIATTLADGIKTSANKAKTAAQKMVEDAASSASKSASGFKGAGLACAQGFANGIASGSHLAGIQAYAMGRAALAKAKAAIDSNSPSKEFIKLGGYVPQGFAIGIGMFGDRVKDSVKSMSSKAISGTKNAIARISEAISSDIDTQPTIRPVLDLTNVTSGARTLNGMLSVNPSLGTLATVNAINSSMNSRNQNGVNSDVVDAIERLDRSIRKSSGNTYNLGNIEYTRGSEVADAIETLVRAARIDGRS